MDTQNIDQKQNESIVQNRRLVEVLMKKVNFLRAVIYILVAGLILVTILIVSLSIFSPEVGNYFEDISHSLKPPQASLYLSPNVANYKEGDEFNMDVMVNTNGNNVVVVAAYLSYNKEQLQAISIDLTDSLFQFVAEKQIISQDGKIKITIGKPTPGINTNAGKVATIRFKAIKEINPESENISFDFTQGSSLFSGVFVDDKQGTNALNKTSGAKIFID